MATTRQLQQIKQDDDKKRRDEATLLLLLTRFLNKLKKDIKNGNYTLNIYSDQLKEILQDLYLKIQTDFTKRVQRQLKLKLNQISQSAINQLIMNWSDNRSTNVSSAMLTTMQKTLAALIGAGLIGKKLADEWLSATKARVTHTGVVTEVQSSAEHARHATAIAITSQFGISMKKLWKTVGDDRVRLWHAEAEGQTVLVGEPYIVGPDKLQYPKDPTGVPANIINCRCASIYLV